MPDQTPPKPKKLLDQLRHAIRLKHYSYSTEKTCVHWVKRYILFHHKRHPAEMGAAAIVFLSITLVIFHNKNRVQSTSGIMIAQDTFLRAHV